MSTSTVTGMPRNVAVIGCGLIGVSWAALCQFYGYHVIAWDPDDDSRKSFADRVARAVTQLRSLMASSEASSLGSLDVVSSLSEAVVDVDLIQENIPEDAALKRALYSEIIADAPAAAIIASSTSSFTWSELTHELPDATRLVTAHPFNPPHLMPLVELFAATPSVREYTECFYRSLGREVVVLQKDAVGHIANRLASALWREAVNIVSEGIAGVTEVDRAMIHGPGLRWSIIGPHMAYHLGGGAGGLRNYLNHLGSSQERRWQSLGSPTLSSELCDKLVAGIEEEAAGCSVAELEERRDTFLITLLKSRALENS